MLRAEPWTIRAALAWVRVVHRRLPRRQGGRWALRLDRDGETVGGLIVAEAPHAYGPAALAVVRCAVVEGIPNGCSLLYGAASRAARAMGASDLVTWTDADEPGTSLRAAGWRYLGETSGTGGRQLALVPTPKRRWAAPWSETDLLRRFAAACGGDDDPAEWMAAVLREPEYWGAEFAHAYDRLGGILELDDEVRRLRAALARAKAEMMTEV
jgi:hypothetical protein